MSLFKNLFGSTKTSVSLRAQFKDQKYFDKEVARVQEMVQQYATSTNADSDAFHYWSLAAKRCQLMELKYSMGLPVGDIAKDYPQALADYVKGWDKEEATYDDLLRMISLGILFDISIQDFEELKNYTLKTDQNETLTDWTPDGLLWYLINEKLNLPQEDSYKLAWPDTYGKLYQLTALSTAEASLGLKEYLDNWYTLHKKAPWYNSHLKEKGYSGYWAWEAAAVVKLMNLKDEDYKNTPFYPFDIVHWSASH